MSDLDQLEARIRTSSIKIHTPEDFEGMRRAGRLGAECLDMLTPYVVAGAVTDELDRLAREFVLDHGALPACLFYRGYSKTVCISPNHVVCHGIPAPKALKDGDLVNVALVNEADLYSTSEEVKHELFEGDNIVTSTGGDYGATEILDRMKRRDKSTNSESEDKLKED